MDRPVVNTLGLCAGVGMLDIGVAAALEQLGFNPHATALCEWEAYAASVLLERMEESALEPCPIWCGDLRDFNGKPFRGVVDVISAGLPCQPYSVAGKQLGLADRRSYGEDGEGPIPQFLRIVSECRPAVVFCENVPPWILRGYFRPVGEELSRMGYTIESPLFITAESVGASHKRERVFVLAYATSSDTRFFDLQRRRERKAEQTCMESNHVANANSKRRQQNAGSTFGNENTNGRKGRNQFEQSSNNESECNDKSLVNSESCRTFEPITESDSERISANSFGSGEQLAHAASERFRETWRVCGGPQERIDRSNSELADTSGKGLPRRCGDGIAIQSQHSELVTCLPGLFAPGPNANWGKIPPQTWPSIESGFRVLVDGTPVVVDASRADQLRCGGNGCVPLQAAVAFVELFSKAMSRIA